jgi:hypothetical protein
MTDFVHAGDQARVTVNPMRLRAASLPVLILAVIALSAALVAPGSAGNDELGRTESAIEATALHVQSVGRAPARDGRDRRELRWALDALRWSCVVQVAVVLSGRLWVRTSAPARTSLVELCRAGPLLRRGPPVVA